MGGKSSPPPPDYTGAANAQAAASKDLTREQTYANRPTLNTPFGQQTWNTQTTIDPSSGKPVTEWASNITLNPQQQAALDSQMRVQTGRSQGAEALLQQALQGLGVDIDPSNYQLNSQQQQQSGKGASNQPDYNGFSGPAAEWVPPVAATGPQPVNSMVGREGYMGGLGRLVTTGTGRNGKATYMNFKQADGQYNENGSAAMSPVTPEVPGYWRAGAAPAAGQRSPSGGQPMSNMAGYRSPQRGAPGRATGIDYSGISQGADRLEAEALGSRDWRGMAQEAALGFNKPLQEERRAALEGQLANMGLSRGSEAWNTEMRRLSDQETRDNLQVFDTARREAQLMGDQSVQRQSMDVQRGTFNQQLRQQEIAELMSKRSQPLNELNALLTGQQVGMPQMPTFNPATKADTPQLLGAAQSQYSAALDASNAKNAAFGNALGGIASIGGAAMGAGGWGGLFRM